MFRPEQELTKTIKKILMEVNRGEVLEDTFWCPWPRRSSPWPWPRSLKSSKIALSLARVQQYFLNGQNFVDNLKKILKIFFFENTCASVLDLEHFCPWPRTFFMSLALASSLVSSTPPLEIKWKKEQLRKKKCKILILEDKSRQWRAVTNY